MLRSPGPSATIKPWLTILPSPSTSMSLLIEVFTFSKLTLELAPMMTLPSPLTPNLAPGCSNLMIVLSMVWSLSMLRMAFSPRLAFPVKVEPLVRLSLAPLTLLRLRLPSTSTSSKTLLPLPITNWVSSSKVREPPVTVPPLNSQLPVLLLKV